MCVWERKNSWRAGGQQQQGLEGGRQNTGRQNMEQFSTTEVEHGLLLIHILWSNRSSRQRRHSGSTLSSQNHKCPHCGCWLAIYSACSVWAQYRAGYKGDQIMNTRNTAVIFNSTRPGNQTKNKIRTHLRLYSASYGLSEPEPEF